MIEWRPLFCRVAPVFAAALFGAAPPVRAADPPRQPASVASADGWRYTVFTDGSFGRIINRQSPQNFRSDYRMATIGLSVRPDPTLSFGVGLSGSESETRFRTGAGSGATDLVIGYGYVQLTGFGFVNLTASGGLGRSDTSTNRPAAPLVPGAVSNYGGNSSFASLGLSAVLPLSPMLIVPSASIGWSNGRSGAFVDSLGIAVSPFGNGSTQAEIGATGYYGVAFGEVVIAPYLGAYYQHDFDLPATLRQKSTAKLVAGLSAAWRDLTFLVEGRSVVGRNDYESHQLRASISYRF